MDGFYSRMQGGQVTDLPDSTFAIRDGMLTAAPGAEGKWGHLGTDRKLTHYRSRIEYRFTGTGGMTGFLYQVDEAVSRPDGRRPRSFESRVREGDAGRAFSHALANFTTRATAGRFDPEGPLTEACGKTTANPCEARDFGPGANPDRPGEWNRMEVVVRGSDSALHRINDSTVLRLWDLRVAADTGGAASAPHGSGSLALLAEGAGIVYRNWEIMELPPDGPSSLQRLILANTDGGERLTPGGTHAIAWRTLGEVNKVSLFWHAGDGLWEMMADNITNTGTFEWTVPAVTTRSLRVKVTAAPWVQADSSGADNSIGMDTGLERSLQVSPRISIDLRDGCDAAGRAIPARARTGRRALFPVP